MADSDRCKWCTEILESSKLRSSHTGLTKRAFVSAKIKYHNFFSSVMQ